jgi:hypothetical protein
MDDDVVVIVTNVGNLAMGLKALHCDASTATMTRLRRNVMVGEIRLVVQLWSGCTLPGTNGKQ